MSKNNNPKIETILPTIKEILLENNIPFELKNNGYHIIIRTKNKRYDFWPTSGKWMVNSDFKIKTGGITGLIEEIVTTRDDKNDDIDEILMKDIDEMTETELKETIYMLCSYINKKLINK